MRLKEKRLVTDRKGCKRIRLIYDQARMPFARLEATAILSRETVT